MANQWIPLPFELSILIIEHSPCVSGSINKSDGYVPRYNFPKMELPIIFNSSEFVIPEFSNMFSN